MGERDNGTISEEDSATQIALASAIGNIIAEYGGSFAVGVFVGFWLASFYRIVKRNGNGQKRQ